MVTLISMCVRGCLLGVFIALSAVGVADEELYYNGAPRLLGGGHLQLVREKVLAKVGPRVEVYGRFEIRNDGQATAARIGFPDGNNIVVPKDKPWRRRPGLMHLRMTVDGKPVTVQTETMHQAPKPFYRVVSVQFSGGQTHILEIRYDMELSTTTTVALQSGNKEAQREYLAQFQYGIYTGDSWLGKVAEATVEVSFDLDGVAQMHAVPVRLLTKFLHSRNQPELTFDDVVWSGFAMPEVRGTSLVFRRKNFKPTPGSDINVYFVGFPG